ncbi:ABC transporter substrate-binding protein [Spiractinospora alimapuensis]|uniref:ABC transporter substrate-binding protein n=1 Tax=Spiractinospora alimapuensis TaxID=2820884 RepID=UPI001F15C45E|nr:ABC transporter substrate-binding protein [Spiractinospora alimapuensis]QVQ50494.1 ABC transporter substrate-binding protein [Spiractinospora alimapuensis]
MSVRQRSQRPARRWSAVAATAALGLVLTTSCGEPPSSGEAGSAAGLADDPQFVWAVTGADRQIHEDVARAWNEANPDRQVEIFFLPPTADEQRQAMFQDLQTQAGQFDVLGLDVIWTGEFADYGYITSMEDHRDAVEGVSLDGPLRSAEWDNELFALPYSSNAAFLYYRTDLVDEPPETWQQLMESGLEIAEREGISGYVAQGDQYEGFVANYLEFFWAAGGEIFDSDQSRSEFLAGDAADTALSYMHDAYANGLFAPGFDSMVEDDARALFQAGDAVYMRNWPYAVPLMEGEGGEETAVAGSFDIAPLPTFDGEGTTSALGGLNNAVSTISDKRELAEEFVVWAATSTEAQEVLASHNLPPTMERLYDEHTDDRTFQVLREVQRYSQPRPPVPGYNSLSLAMQDNLHPAYRGEKNLDSALSSVDTAATDALSNR